MTFGFDGFRQVMGKVWKLSEVTSTYRGNETIERASNDFAFHDSLFSAIASDTRTKELHINLFNIETRDRLMS